MKNKGILLLLAALLFLHTLCLPVTAENDSPMYITVAQPKTNVLGDIAIVREINSAEEYRELVNSKNKPAVALMQLNGSLEVLGDDKSVISSLTAFLADTAYSVLPALRIEDEAAADALIAYTQSSQFSDLFFLTDSTDLLKKLKAAIPTATGVLDGTSSANTMTKDDCIALRKEIWTCGGTVAYLSAQAISRDLLLYLQSRHVSVWLDGGDITDTGALTSLLLSGAYGVVSDSAESLLDIAVNKLPKRTLVRPSALIGHRGSAAAPENTVEGALYAYENGADAVEFDVMLTADGVPVVIHDDWTGRTCGTNISVPASTLEQIKSLYANVGFENDPRYAECRIPTLDEFLTAFADKDCQMVIEIKTADPAILPLVKDLIEEKGMYDRSNVICFFPEQLRLFREIYPEMPVGYLCENVMGSGTADRDFRLVMEKTGSIPSTYSPGYSGIDSNSMRAATLRGHGIYIWTIGGGKAQYCPPLRDGITAITGNNVEYVNDIVLSLSTDAPLKETYRVGDVLSPAFTVTDYLERSTAVTEEDSEHLDVVILDGEDCVSFTEDGLVFHKEGTVTFSYILKQKLGASLYHVISEPQTVTVAARASAGFTIMLAACLAILAVLIAIPIIIVVRKRKKANP